MTGALVLITNAAATLFMVGLIWLIQIVHYPLMGTLSAEAMPSYARAHQRRITFIVGPAMLIEAISSIALIFVHPVGVSWPALVAGLLLVVFIFYRTATLHVPQHQRLAHCYDPKVCQDLIRTNWWRTVAWTSRGAIVLFLLGETTALQ